MALAGGPRSTQRRVIRRGTRARPTGAAVGLVAGALLLVAAFVVPPLTGWDVAARSDRFGVPPLHGYWQFTVGPGTIPAIVIAVLGVRFGPTLADRLSWGRLQVLVVGVALAWLCALALVDGASGLDRVLGNPYEYLRTARAVDDVPAMLAGFVDRIGYDHPDNWVTHVAGHPPGALLFFVGLVQVGLGGDLAAGLVVTALAATLPAAVLSTLRTLGAEQHARIAAPYLVLGPAAVFLAVSADAVFAVVAAWGLALLARSATARTTRALLAWGIPAGLVLGSTVMLSYGLPLLGLLALAVLAAARSWRPLPVAVLAALAVVLTFAALGFVWWEAFPVLRERYWDGIASRRPASYWFWGNLAALLFSAGPLLAAGLGHLASLLRREGRAAFGTESDTGRRTVLLLACAGVAAVTLANLSGMSKAEVERIWLPFVPWLLLSLTLLPTAWRRPGLALQVSWALLVQHLLYTSW